MQVSRSSCSEHGWWRLDHLFVVQDGPTQVPEGARAPVLSGVEEGCIDDIVVVELERSQVIF